MELNFLSAALNLPQWVVLGVCTLGVIFFAAVFFYFVYLLVYKPELKAEIAAKAKQFKQEARRLKAENERNLAELKRSGKEIDQKNKKTTRLEEEIAKMQAELMQQGIEEERAKEISAMSLVQLQALKSKEMTDVSGAFIVNAITRKVLIDHDFERRTDIEDFKVPMNKTTGITTEAVENLLSSLIDVTREGGKGKRAAVYKTVGRSVAFLYDQGDGKFKLTVKCGSYYGLRLSGLYPEFVEKATYPYGMTWFNVTSADGCSLELIKLLVDISYQIAKAGF